MSFRASEALHGIQKQTNWITRSSRVMTKKRLPPGMRRGTCRLRDGSQWQHPFIILTAS